MIIENYLSTNATYPITYGTAITVACDPEYDLLGSEVITCVKGIVYSHSSRRPKCVSKGKQGFCQHYLPLYRDFNFCYDFAISCLVDQSVILLYC